jgi:hypothetical protein
VKKKFLFSLIAIPFLFIIIGKANAQDYVLKENAHTGTYSFAPFNGKISFSGKCIYLHKAGTPKDIPIYLQKLVGESWKTVAHSSIKGGNHALIKHFQHEYGKKKLGSSYQFLIKNTNAGTVKVILGIMGTAEPQTVVVNNHYHDAPCSEDCPCTVKGLAQATVVGAVSGGIRGSIAGPGGATAGAGYGALIGGGTYLGTCWMFK